MCPPSNVQQKGALSSTLGKSDLEEKSLFKKKTAYKISVWILMTGHGCNLYPIIIIKLFLCKQKKVTFL